MSGGFRIVSDTLVNIVQVAGWYTAGPSGRSGQSDAAGSTTEQSQEVGVR